MWHKSALGLATPGPLVVSLSEYHTYAVAQSSRRFQSLVHDTHHRLQSTSKIQWCEYTIMMYRFNDVENFYFLAMPCIRACTASIVACSFMYFHICLLISCCFILCLFSVFWNTVFQKIRKSWLYISFVVRFLTLWEKQRITQIQRFRCFWYVFVSIFARLWICACISVVILFCFLLLCVQWGVRAGLWSRMVTLGMAAFSSFSLAFAASCAASSSCWAFAALSASSSLLLLPLGG